LKDTISAEEAIRIIENIALDIERNQDYLTDLDQAIGDGDHGINLTRGFKVVLETIKELKENNIGEILKKVGSTLISNLGGAVGPLYGFAFIRAGESVGDKNEVDIKDLAGMFEAAEKGIMTIGNAQLEEKTMLDTIHPAVLAMRKAAEKNYSIVSSFKICVKAAEEGMKKTIDMISKRGRSSYLGNRSKGHQDVGATSAYIMLNSAMNSLEKINY
jgi:dihydroxyacetone kinase-like protein